MFDVDDSGDCVGRAFARFWGMGNGGAGLVSFEMVPAQRLPLGFGLAVLVVKRWVGGFRCGVGV